MKRLLWIAVGVVLVLALAGAVVVPRLLDVEVHRPAIEAAIASAAGRTAALGALKLRLFPTPQLTADGLSIGEDPAFGSEPFLRTERVEIRVKLWPLFSRRVSIESLTLERPELKLRRNRQGLWNVFSLGAATASPTPAAPSTAPGLTLSADRIAIRGGRIVLVDEGLATGKPLTAEAREVDLTLTDLAAETAVKIDLSMELVGLGRTRIEGRVGPFVADADGSLPVDLKFAGGQAALTGTLTGIRKRPGADARLIATKVELREIAPALRLLGSLLPAGLAMKGEVSLDTTVRGTFDDPAGLAVHGTASVSGLELADPSLSQPITSIAGTLHFEGDRARIAGFEASLGKSSVKGGCSITRFAKPVIEIQLEAPLLDVDEVLSFLPASGASAPAAPAASAGAPAPGDVSLLRNVTIRGDLAAERVQVMNLQLSKAKAKLGMESGSARLTGISVDLYGGRMTGEVTTDLTAAGPPFKLSGHLAGVDFDAFSRDLSKDLAGLLTGTLETSLDVRGRGLDSEALRRALAGRGTLALRNGKLKSISVLKTVARALEAAGGKGVGENETPFDALTGTFDIADGWAKTQDLLLASPDLSLMAKGSFGLDLTLGLDVDAKFSPAVSADMVAKTGSLKYLQDPEGRVELSLALSGALASPKVGLDKGMIERAAKSAVKDKLRDKGENFLKKLLDRKRN